MQWNGLFRTVGDAIRNHKEAALFGVGTALVITTGIAAAKAAPAAERKTDDIRYDAEQALMDGEDEAEVKKRVVKGYLTEVAPLYLPAVASGALAIAAFGMSNKALAKRAAASAAAYSVAEHMLNSYQGKVIEKLGEDADKEIMQAVASEIPDDVLEKARGYLTDDDVANRFPREINDKLYYDHVTGRIFWSSDEKIKDAESTVNKLLIDTGIATINDFYAQLCLDCDSVVGEAVGWRVDDPMARSMDVIFGSRLDPMDNTPMVTIGYRTCAVNPRALEHR